ncbi:transposase [Pseudoclavibacter sp. 8L]|nr:transposase [Pseudoclavibacter sp. 8L]
MVRITWDPDAVAHMRDRHGVEPHQAEEALDDPEALLRSPDPASRSGRSDRYIGWSTSLQQLLVVIVIRHDGCLFGGNAWPANASHRKLYEERRDND